MIKFRNILIGVLTVVMTSCSGVLESKKIIELSKDQHLQIEVQAKREGSLEPFVVELLAKKEGIKPLVVKTEIYNDDITRDNVTFDWQSNNYCIISIAHRDGKVATIPVKFRGVE